MKEAEQKQVVDDNLDAYFISNNTRIPRTYNSDATGWKPKQFVKWSIVEKCLCKETPRDRNGG